MAKFTFLHLYPKTLRLNGEVGNVTVLKRRLEILGHQVQLQTVEVGQRLGESKPDFIFIGSGTNAAAEVAFGDMPRFKEQIASWVDSGTAILGVGVGFALLSQSYKTKRGSVLEGFGLADIKQFQNEKYLVGEVVLENGMAGFINSNLGIVSLPALENRQSLGVVTSSDNKELIGYRDGYHRENVWGSNVQGPLLAMNPSIADAIVSKLVGEFSTTAELSKLDELALKTRQAISSRVGGQL